MIVEAFAGIKTNLASIDISFTSKFHIIIYIFNCKFYNWIFLWVLY